MIILALTTPEYRKRHGIPEHPTTIAEMVDGDIYRNEDTGAMLTTNNGIDLHQITTDAYEAVRDAGTTGTYLRLIPADTYDQLLLEAITVHMNHLSLGEPRYTVSKDSYDRDCEHPTCAVTCKARGLHNVTYDAPRREYADAEGTRRVWSTTGHCVTRVSWVVLDAQAPGYSVESFETRREARDEAARLNR